MHSQYVSRIYTRASLRKNAFQRSHVLLLSCETICPHFITVYLLAYRTAMMAMKAPKTPPMDAIALTPAPRNGATLLEATPPVDATEGAGATPEEAAEVVIGKGADEVVGDELATVALLEVATGAAEVATADVDAGAAAAVEDAATGPAEAAQAQTADAEA